jgi:glycosyltransferase involved in cell wall biosynthesis
MRINLHIYPSPFKNESRILRETKSIISLGLADSVYIAASWTKGLAEEEDITDKIKVYRLRSVFNKLRKGSIGDIARFFAFMFQIVFKFRGKNKPAIVNCHSLSVLLVGVFFKIFYGARLIYDAHELETERNGVFGYRKSISKFLERSLIRRSDKVIVVCDKIAEWYVEHYPFMKDKIYVIRNIPEALDKTSPITADLKKEFDIPASSLLFIYQGGFSNGRGIKIMLDAFAGIPDKYVVFMGFGPLRELISEYSKTYPNIFLKEAVPPSVLIAYTRTADIGISLIENICLSYYYSLPNKVFEYSMAGVPLIVSDFPEMSSYVGHYKIGWSVNPDLEDLKAILNKIDKQTIDLIKPNFEKVYKEISWEIEQERLMGAYDFNQPATSTGGQKTLVN